MEVNKKQILYVFLIIIWMATVFAFSNQPAEKSSRTSGNITEKVVKVITKDNKKITQTEKDSIETIIRKCAHFVLYLIGGVLVINFIITTRVEGKYVIIYTILFTFVYAITDEVHQIFVPGRSGEIRDILIDTVGANCGTLLFLKFRKLLNRRK